MRDVDSDSLITIPLAEDELELLRTGLSEWGGPARCTAALAVAMGFDSVEHLLAEGRRLRYELAAGSRLTREDWIRSVVATEIVFVSDVYGSGSDWHSTTGLSDEATIRLLRVVQAKVAAGIREHRSRR